MMGFSGMSTRNLRETIEYMGLDTSEEDFCKGESVLKRSCVRATIRAIVEARALIIRMGVCGTV